MGLLKESRHRVMVETKKNKLLKKDVSQKNTMRAIVDKTRSAFFIR